MAYFLVDCSLLMILKSKFWSVIGTIFRTHIKCCSLQLSSVLLFLSIVVVNVKICIVKQIITVIIKQNAEVSAVSARLRLVLCSKRGPINSKRWPKASTGRRNFSRNSLGFWTSNSRLSSNFLGRRIIWRLRSSLEFLFTRRRHVFTPQFVFLKSYSVCLQVTWDLYFALVIYKLDSCKNTSRTLVKVLLNWILTFFYTCSTTPVITSRTLVTWTCDDFY